MQPQDPSYKKSLQRSEWLLVGSLLLIMASLVVVAKVNTCRAEHAISQAQWEPEEPTQITIWVKGAVAAPIELVMPSQSRICDLKSKIQLSEEADKTFFRRKKRLKNGEVIWVPKKAVIK